MRKAFVNLLPAVWTALICNLASADEQLHPIATEGDWMAVAHSVSMTEAPDVCIAGNMRVNVLFRASASSLELRVADEGWSLPAQVTGKIDVVVGAKDWHFEIDSNTDKMVAATVSQTDALDLFHAMDKASMMTVTTGHEKPRRVSLSGSTKVMTAFRTCAGIKSEGMSGGDNPFAAPEPGKANP